MNHSNTPAPIITESELKRADTNVLNLDQMKMLLQKTPSSHVYKRPAKGGGEWSFVTGVYVKKVLNILFGFDWDFEVVGFDVRAGQCIVQGKLTCRSKGRVIVKHQFGRADIKYKTVWDEKLNRKVPTDQELDLGNDLKAATTDALKKCASELGVASDIYGAKEFQEVNLMPDDYDEIPEDLLEHIKKCRSIEDLDLLIESEPDLKENKAWTQLVIKQRKLIHKSNA